MKKELTVDTDIISSKEFSLLKFGGSSIATAKRLHKVAQIISDKQSVFVVLSAVFGTTDKLIKLSEFIKEKKVDQGVRLLIQLKADYGNLIQELYRESETKLKAKIYVDEFFDKLEDKLTNRFSLRLEREILAVGEYISSFLLSILLRQKEKNVVLLDATELIYIDKFSKPDYSLIKEYLQNKLNEYPKDSIFITQGFLCTNHKGEIDNLSRGGSDYTATILASILKVSQVEIWTDIDGLHNNDPRYVPKTIALNYISYEEAEHLAFFGAKILHPHCIEPVKKANIPIVLKNTLNPSHSGTIIHSKVIGEGVKAIAAKDQIQIVKIYSNKSVVPGAFYHNVFSLLYRLKIHSDIITSSEELISLAISEDYPISKLSKSLGDIAVVEVEKNLSAICIVGSFLKEAKGIVKRISDSLFDISLRMISYGGTNYHVVLLVHSQDKQRALQSLNENLLKNSVYGN